MACHEVKQWSYYKSLSINGDRAFSHIAAYYRAIFRGER
jgi:hypothetical protein